MQYRKFGNTGVQISALGFGCMRFPKVGEEIDIEQVKRMFDIFLDSGFTYFDTAHNYLDGRSETMLKECLTSRYPRDSYILTNKLSTHHFIRNDQIRPLFQSQLEACGVDYFDFYLMHSQYSKNYDHYKKCNAYEEAFRLK